MLGLGKHCGQHLGFVINIQLKEPTNDVDINRHGLVAIACMEWVSFVAWQLLAHLELWHALLAMTRGHVITHELMRADGSTHENSLAVSLAEWKRC